MAKAVATLRDAADAAPQRGRALSHSSLAAIGVAVSFVLTGCSGVPDFDKSEEVTINHIVDQIECELYYATQLPKAGRQLVAENWVASADLTLQVNDSGQLTPSILYTDPLSKVASFTFNGAALLSKTRERTFNESIDVPLNKLSKSDGASCQRLAARGHPYDSQGNNLGLEEIVRMAFRSIRNDPDLFIDESSDTSQPATVGAGNGGSKNTTGFSTTIEFTITKNLNAVGPTWIYTKFKGPGPLGEIERADEQTIMIAFSPGKAGSNETSQSLNLKPGEQGAAGNNRSQLNQQHWDQTKPAPPGFN